jgi:hypothetical protein
MPYEEEDEDYYDDDSEAMSAVRRAVNKAGRQTVAELQKLSVAAGKGLENDERLLAAFNRMTEAVAALGGEIRALREDLNPSLDKPSRLSPPAKPAGNS